MLSDLVATVTKFHLRCIKQWARSPNAIVAGKILINLLMNTY